MKIDEYGQGLIIDRPVKNGCGFFDLPKQEQCTSKEHNPPKNIYIPQGKGYRHVCPDCGKETIITNPITY